MEKIESLEDVEVKVRNTNSVRQAGRRFGAVWQVRSWF